MEFRQGPVEEMVNGPLPFGGVFSGARVLITGHTGFKGAWLTEWLLQLGATVGGYSIDAPASPALSAVLDWSGRIQHWTGDIGDRAALRQAFDAFQPQFVFHLAAQPLVRASYADPVGTFRTNVLGTLEVLDAARTLGNPCTTVGITTDKCYENREWLHGYRECDPLGGHDPYSASKAAAEIAIASFRSSFLSGSKHRLASARAGNVIGGGDWAADRIVPDAMRARSAGRAIEVRNPGAIRPWQHVLEPLSGYLWLAARLHCATPENAVPLAGAFNFGPAVESQRPVRDLVEEIANFWPGTWRDASDPTAPHEAGRLQLAIDKAHALLGWKPVWNFSTTVAATVNWYRAAHETPQPERLRDLTRGQIESYVSDARAAGLAWARGVAP